MDFPQRMYIFIIRIKVFLAFLGFLPGANRPGPPPPGLIIPIDGILDSLPEVFRSITLCPLAAFYLRPVNVPVYLAFIHKLFMSTKSGFFTVVQN